MSREISNPAIEADWRTSLRVKAGIAAGVLALTGVAATSESQPAQAAAKASHPLEYVGVATNQIWVPDLDQARQVVQQIADTGANTVHIYEPLSPGQTEIENDKLRLCNAAEAAREKNLTLEVSFIGYNNKKTGYIPSGSGAVTKFIATATKIVYNIAGPNANKPGDDGSPACVQEPLKSLIVLPFNEPNSKQFNAARDPAKDYAYLMSRAYPALKTTEQAINQSFAATGDAPLTLKVASGGLTATHDPVGFRKQYNKSLKDLGVQSPPEDMLALHPYPKNPKDNPADVQARLYELIERENISQWGEPIPIIYDEFGSFAISAAKRSLYGPKSLKAPLVSEGRQAEYYSDALKEASQEPETVGAMIFQGRDNPNDGWPTGVVSPDGVHKASWNQFANTVHNVIIKPSD